MKLIPDYAGARVEPSPNHGERVGVDAPDMIILHYTGMPDHGQALSWLKNIESQVSSHYFVWPDGRIVQMVPETRRAWHAGKSVWAGETDINSRSIGIEIANAGHPGGLPTYPEEQIAAVIGLCRDLMERWRIAPERVLGHSDVAPRRKVDPGENFPWDRLYREGSGTGWSRAPSVAVVISSVARRGSRSRRCRACWRSTATGLISPASFAIAPRAWWKPSSGISAERVDGIADMSTIDTLHRLLAALPRFQGTNEA